MFKLDTTHDKINELVSNLINQITETIHDEVRKRLADEPQGGLMKVSRAAEWLEVHPDHVYRLIHSGELVGFPFPDENSHMHVEVSSLRELIRHRATTKRVNLAPNR